MTDTLIMAAIGIGLLSLVIFVIGLLSALFKRAFGVATALLLAMTCFVIASLLGTLTLATQGYRALTKEEVAATVRIEPTGRKLFMAHFEFPDGRSQSYPIAGDQLYVDAHILKWKPIANILGLHTAYELDRVTGRYMRLGDELASPRTVYGLSTGKSLDIFDLRQQYSFLEPLLDAEYGSASFVPATTRAEYEVRVSVNGLLIRPVGN